MRKRDINKKIMSTTVRILVILPNNIGDIIMSTPVLEGLKAKYPDSNITFFAEEGFEGGIQNNPFIDEMFLFKRKSIRNSFIKGEWQAGSCELIDVLSQVTTTRYDLLINLSQHSYISNLIPFFTVQSVIGCLFLPDCNYALLRMGTETLYAIPSARGYSSLQSVEV